MVHNISFCIPKLKKNVVRSTLNLHCFDCFLLCAPVFTPADEQCHMTDILREQSVFISHSSMCALHYTFTHSILTPSLCQVFLKAFAALDLQSGCSVDHYQLNSKISFSQQQMTVT